MVIACIFLQLGIEKPSWLDLGAHHPVDISNTALFYARGGRGINVEANPDLMADFHRLRPQDINLNCGVGPERGKMTLYPYFRGSGGTFRRDWATGIGMTFEREGGSHEVDVYTVDEIIDVHGRGQFPHLLCVDIEGMDEEVLAALDFAKRAPMVIDVEAFVGSRESYAIRHTLEGKGFVFLMRCGHNCVFVREDLGPRLF